MEAKRVLIVTYYFPPRPGVASLRLRGLAKYLPEFGWQPVILTAALPKPPAPQFQVFQTFYPGDATSLLKKKLRLQPEQGFQEQVGIPLAIRESGHSNLIGKLMTFVKGILFYPDDQIKWLPFAVEAGHSLLREGKFAALLSSAGPVVTHLIAKDLQKKTRIPWVADFRDLWTQNHYYPHNLIRKWFERRLELKTLALADALVTVSNPLADKLSLLHQGKPAFFIPNGFDSDEVRIMPVTKEFTITYTGHLYEGKRNPHLLLVALAALINEKAVNPNVIRIRFFGPIEYWLEQEIKKYHLEEIAKQYGAIPRETALEKQRESQILLMLSWDDSREQGVYSGKIFEYLAAGRPILATGGPKGVVSELLEKTQAGIHVSDLQILKDILSKYYKEYERTGVVPYYGNKEEMEKYSHREMAKKFTSVLNQVQRVL